MILPSPLHEARHGPIWPAVSLRRIFSLLLLVSFVLAPLSMVGGSSAMAMAGHAMAGMSHPETAQATPPCHKSKGGDEAPDIDQPTVNCCVMMCVAIPPIGGQLAAHVLPDQIRQSLPLAPGPHGLEPEADPPPPRFS